MKRLLPLLLLQAVCYASQESDALLYNQLSPEEDEALTALEAILESPESISSVPLFSASSVALNEERYADSAFLFYIAKFRAQYDLEIYEPIGAGGDSPMVLFSALSHQIGSAINPEIMKRPDDFSKAVDRAVKWRPTIPEDYHPGWAYSKRKTSQRRTRKSKN